MSNFSVYWRVFPDSLWIYDPVEYETLEDAIASFHQVLKYTTDSTKMEAMIVDGHRTIVWTYDEDDND